MTAANDELRIGIQQTYEYATLQQDVKNKAQQQLATKIKELEEAQQKLTTTNKQLLQTQQTLTKTATELEQAKQQAKQEVQKDMARAFENFMHSFGQAPAEPAVAPLMALDAPEQPKVTCRLLTGIVPPNAAAAAPVASGRAIAPPPSDVASPGLSSADTHNIMGKTFHLWMYEDNFQFITTATVVRVKGTDVVVKVNNAYGHDIDSEMNFIYDNAVKAIKLFDKEEIKNPEPRDAFHSFEVLQVDWSEDGPFEITGTFTHSASFDKPVWHNAAASGTEFKYLWQNEDGKYWCMGPSLNEPIVCTDNKTTWPHETYHWKFKYSDTDIVAMQICFKAYITAPEQDPDDSDDESDDERVTVKAGDQIYLSYQGCDKEGYCVATITTVHENDTVSYTCDKNTQGLLDDKASGELKYEDALLARYNYNEKIAIPVPHFGTFNSITVTHAAQGAAMFVAQYVLNPNHINTDKKPFFRRIDFAARYSHMWCLPSGKWVSGSHDHMLKKPLTLGYAITEHAVEWPHHTQDWIIETVKTKIFSHATKAAPIYVSAGSDDEEIGGAPAPAGDKRRRAATQPVARYKPVAPSKSKGKKSTKKPRCDGAGSAGGAGAGAAGGMR